MDFMNNFEARPQVVQPKTIYQDTRGTSQYWRRETRVWHPLTTHQYENTRFRAGDKVSMRLRSPEGTNFEDYTILRITKYDTAKEWLGSYNSNDSFRGVPFTHTLVLQRS